MVELALWLYLWVALLPALLAWRRELPARSVGRAAMLGVLLGWTLVGYVAAWIVAIDSKPASGMRVFIDLR